MIKVVCHAELAKHLITLDYSNCDKMLRRLSMADDFYHNKTLRSPKARGLAHAALVAAGGVGVAVVAYFYRQVLAYQLFRI